MKPPEPPKRASKELLKAIGPLPKCKHGDIYSICSICNKEFYFPEIYNKKKLT